MKKKVIALVLVCVLVFGVAVGGTLAWLADKTQAVENVFTVGDVDINLTETTGDSYKIVPGTELKKDPTVTVTADSETCYVFVKLEEKNKPTGTNDVNYFDWAIAAGWTAVDGQQGVYWREVESDAANKTFPVLADNEVTFSNKLTKQQLQAATGDNQPKLTITAYAVQKVGMDDVAAAWEAAQTAVETNS